MTCRYEGCTNEVAAPGMSRCDLHRLRWMVGGTVEKPANVAVVRLPEWRRRSLAKDFSGRVA